MHQSFLRSFVIAVVAALAVTLSPRAFAQAVVSSTLSGTLLDQEGKPLAGANVTAVHVPTNSSYTAITSPTGRFSFTGLRVGGPYDVSASVEGYKIEVLSGVQTRLAEDTEVALVGKPEVLQLEKFVATGSRSELDGNATGASSVLSNRRIAAQPSVSRSFAG